MGVQLLLFQIREVLIGFAAGFRFTIDIGKILDKERGGSLGFKVSSSYSIHSNILTHTNVLITTFDSTKEGCFEVMDFMPRYKTGEEQDYYIPSELYRLIRVRRGNRNLQLIMIQIELC